MTFDCPGKWEVQTTEDGGFSVKNLTHSSVSVDLPFEAGFSLSGEELGQRAGFCDSAEK